MIPPDGDGSPDSDAGQTVALGDFRIIREIGRGGMGVVYEATQLSLGRRVALKVLPFAAVMDSKQLLRFKNEASAAAQLHHTNIVPVFSVGSERGVHFYAMQFIEGHTLAEVIGELRRTAGLEEQEVIGDRLSVIGEGDEGNHGSSITDYRSPPSTSPLAALSTERSTKPREFFRTVARLGIEAAEALDHAHLVGIIHRDIKPRNLMLDVRGNLWITDFGLARVGTDTNLTMTGDLIGTLRYMSPEQALAKRVVVDHRTDIYSLGVTLYELLTLRPLFSGEDRQEILRQIAFDEPQPPRRINDRIPPELETIVLKATAKNPTERYATAKELADDLERLLRDEPIRARRPTLVQRARKWSRRHQPLVVSVAVCVIVAVVTLAGSVGWVMRDRAVRLMAIEREVKLALDEAMRLMNERHWPEALSAARRADGLLAVGGRNELVEVVQRLRKELELLEHLENVYIEKVAALDGGLDYSEVDARYAQLFAEFGLDIPLGDINAAVQRIRHSVAAIEIASFLDDWAAVSAQVHGVEDSAWKNLLDVARGSDGDELRTRVRESMKNDDKEALAELASEIQAETQTPLTLRWLAGVLHNSGKTDQAVSLLRTASQSHPGDFWIHYQMAVYYHDMQPPQWGEMVRCSSVALALRPNNAEVTDLFADALRHNGELDRSLAASKRAILMKPDYARAHNNLGITLEKTGDLAGAISEYQTALRLKVDHVEAHHNLGNALKNTGDLKGAIEEYRTALRLKPDLVEPHVGLSAALIEIGNPQESITESQIALRLKPGDAVAHNNLGLALAQTGDLEGAITEYQTALRLKADYAYPHYNLGNALSEKHDRNGAIAEYQIALRLKPDYAEAHINLGNRLYEKGQFRESLEHIRRGHDLGSRKANWPYPTAKYVAEGERLVELEDELPGIIRGEAKPRDDTERLEFAWICARKQLNATAAQLYVEAFVAQPELAADFVKQHRYNAACAAALAGCSQGEDARAIDDAERARLRQQAFEWLRADLDCWRKLLEGDSADSRARVVKTLKHWQTDSDLAGVRDPAALGLAKLPEPEREAWSKLWAEVGELIREAGI
jgi:serine/threonine protein kinase/Flp pilus assembly protein TadD